jgi:predicted AlkP superfamily phosphohydrolase/phosphomutase
LVDEMRVLILGIDALDYDLVNKWDLKNLKQLEYGKVIVPITKATVEPATEIVWPCFITGKEPKEMGFDSPVLYRQPYKWFYDHIYSITPSQFDDVHPENIISEKNTKRLFLDKISSILTKIGFFYHPSRSDIKAPTLFDNNSLKTAHFHIPVYDKDPFPEYRKQIVDVIMKKISVSEFNEECKRSFNDRANKLIQYLKNNNDWNLVMMYWFCLDAIQHAFFNNKLKIMDFYLMFNEFIGALKSKLTSETLLLIISDHGQKKGIHTNYGFYSCNKKLSLINPNIIEFKEILEREITKKNNS